MVVYANAVPAGPKKDGIVYASAVVLPTTEADLGVPVPVLYGQVCLAIVVFTLTGGPGTNTSYVALQTDLNADGNWIDVAAFLASVTTASQIVAIFGGVPGTVSAPAIQRASNTAPAASIANQVPLGGRLRFTGKSVVSGGTNPAISATITYKLLGLS